MSRSKETGCDSVYAIPNLLFVRKCIVRLKIVLIKLFEEQLLLCFRLLNSKSKASFDFCRIKLNTGLTFNSFWIKIMSLDDIIIIWLLIVWNSVVTFMKWNRVKNLLPFPYIAVYVSSSWNFNFKQSRIPIEQRYVIAKYGKQRELRILRIVWTLTDSILNILKVKRMDCFQIQSINRLITR